jgi:hypothetical protein
MSQRDSVADSASQRNYFLLSVQVPVNVSVVLPNAPGLFRSPWRLAALRKHDPRRDVLACPAAYLTLLQRRANARERKRPSFAHEMNEPVSSAAQTRPVLAERQRDCRQKATSEENLCGDSESACLASLTPSRFPQTESGAAIGNHVSLNHI